ncbi:MAG TPA: uroporphyrinogen decarboxylase family protein [Firmicutes bacterium]|nr:uroporphyrinogen decarboxylase family protein [Bacillota bacterium]
MDAIKKLRDFYAMKPGSPFVLREFGFFSLDRWIAEGYLRPYDKVEGDYGAYLEDTFGFDKDTTFDIHTLGWCEAAFDPYFEEVQVEDQGDSEIIRDFAGRNVRYFKGRRSGYMPEYLTAPVTDAESWERDVRWRLDPSSPHRLEECVRIRDQAAAAAKQGRWIVQKIIGGYMYLRSLMGPETLLYMFYDDPSLVHSCMRTWLDLADRMTEFMQQRVTFDEVFFGEDICYNHGPLISPDMMKEFLFPYYQQLLQNIRRRQQKRESHPLHVQVDTDGFCWPVIDLYREAIGVDYFSPFEAASGCDIVESARRWPDLRMSGGMDKRVLAGTKEEIDRYLDGILPALHERGGYIPTCDHGVPEEVPFENYLHFRERIREYS